MSAFSERPQIEPNVHGRKLADFLADALGWEKSELVQSKSPQRLSVWIDEEVRSQAEYGEGGVLPHTASSGLPGTATRTTARGRPSHVWNENGVQKGRQPCCYARRRRRLALTKPAMPKASKTMLDVSGT